MTDILLAQTRHCNIAEIMAEEAAVREKADKIREKEEETEMARGMTLEEVTKGLLYFRYTGLTFQTGGNGMMRYVFLPF